MKPELATECAQARQGLWPPERPRLHGDGVAAAERHVRSCAACQAYFTQERALLELYDRARTQKAPRAVRERVFDALAWERARMTRDARGSRLRGAGLTAAVLFGVLMAGLALRMPAAGPGPGGEGFVEDYIRRAVTGRALDTADPGRVAAFLREELGIGVGPLSGPDVVIEGVEICLVEGRRGAMVLYRVQGREVSHYLIPRAGTAARSASVQTGLEGAPSLVTWSEPSLEQALVGDVDPGRLVTLSKAGT